MLHPLSAVIDHYGISRHGELSLAAQVRSSAQQWRSGRPSAAALRGRLGCRPCLLSPLAFWMARIQL